MLRKIKHSNSKTSINLILIFLFSIPVFSQTPDLQESIEKAMQRQSNKSFSESNENNQIVTIDNSVQQYDELDRLIEEDKFYEDQIIARKRLATELCLLDEKACYLIDNYSKYKSTQELVFDVNDLELFGLDLFSGYPLNFDLVDNTPVPDNYILGFGDVLTLNIIGPRSEMDSFPISRDGTINIPDFGSVYVQNLSFKDAEKKISSFISSKGVGSSVFISLKKLKNITVNIGGSTRYPGTYKISGQSTALNLVAVVGGLIGNPSLRNIKIISSDGAIRYEDLYDSLVYGKPSPTQYLRSGDTVNIPPAENFVYLIGSANRPAIYEFIEGEDTNDLLKMGLGTKPYSDDYMVVKRLNSNGSYLSILASNSNPVKLRNGDILEVNQIEKRFVDGVKVFGAIRRTGNFELNGVKKITSIVSLENDILDSTYLPLFIVKRYEPSSNVWKYKLYNLLNRDAFEDIDIFPRDEIYFLSNEDINFINSAALASYIANLNNNRSKINAATYDVYDQFSGPSNSINANQVTNLGSIDTRLSELESSVNNEGEIGLIRSMQCLDSLEQYLTQNFLKEVTQKTSSFLPKNSEECTSFLNTHEFMVALLLRSSKLIFGDVDMPGILPLGGKIYLDNIFDYVHSSDDYEKFRLSVDNVSFELNNSLIESSDFSFLTFNKIEKDQLTRFVHLSGEFSNPGTYAIYDGDSLTDIYKRAGGLKDTAFPDGAIFTREYLKNEEAKALNIFRNNLSEVLTTAISNGYLQQNPTDLMLLMDVMAQASTVQVSGRLVTDLRPSVKNTTKDLVLLDGDRIYMPRKKNTVNVSGQVLNPSSLVYSPELKPYDYIDSAGGIKEGADKSSIYVINPNGETFNLKSARSFGFRTTKTIMPGATIIVPRKARNLDGLGLVEKIAPTIASLSVTAASIAAIND